MGLYMNDNEIFAVGVLLLLGILSVFLACANEYRRSKNQMIDPNKTDKEALKPDIKTCDAEVWRKSIEDEK